MKRLFVCGTRAVVKAGPSDFRVVCATCDGGGTVSYPTRGRANDAAIRDSNRACRSCGAS